MISREINSCQLSPGSKIIHVGSGPLSMTALSLARAGFVVEALDKDPEAVNKASRLLRVLWRDRSFSVKKAEGLEEDYSSAEAIWVSFSVMPREKVLQKVFSSLKKGGKLVYRNPRGLLALVYPRVEAGSIAPYCPAKKVRQSLGKETLVITKTSES